MNIKEIASELDTLSGESCFYYNKITGELEWFNDDDENPDGLELNEVENNPDYIALPTKFDLDDYGIMKDFMFTQEDEKIRSEMNDALHGNDAFEKFRKVVERHNLLQNWHDFKQADYENEVKNWCEVNELEWE